MGVNRSVVRFTPIICRVHARHAGTARRVEFGEVALVEKGGVGDVEPTFLLNYRGHEDEAVRRKIGDRRMREDELIVIDSSASGCDYY